MDDEAKEILSRSLVHQIERLRAENERLRVLLREAREALAPFAALANEAYRFEDCDGIYTSVGDLRRARAVYEKIKGPE